MSGRDEIEFAKPTFYDCDCCGHRTTKLTRFVTREGSAFAAYYAHLNDGPEHDDVQLLMGFGPWGEDVAPETRTAIAMRLWSTADNFNVSLVDADHWDTQILGRRLTREEALDSPWKQEAFELSDHIVECDQPVVDYLNLRIRGG